MSIFCHRLGYADLNGEHKGFQGGQGMPLVLGCGAVQDADFRTRPFVFYADDMPKEIPGCLGLSAFTYFV